VRAFALGAWIALALGLAPAPALAQTRGAAPPPVPSLGRPQPAFGGSESLDRIPARPPVTYPSTSDAARDASGARSQVDRARREVQALDYRRRTFESLLTTPDRERLAPRLREQDALRLNIQNQIRELDAELARPEPSAERVRLQREQLDRDVQRLEHEYEIIRTP
jgi:hypothetical protein